jgi:hypothetical protein
MATKDQQIKHVVEGVALGVLAQSVEAVTSAKLALELGFAEAWRDWSRAGQYPSLGRRDAGNLFWIGVAKSERRQSVSAAWSMGRWAQPYVLYDGWTVDECLDLHADERASVDDWKELGSLYVATFKPEQIRYAVPTKG